VYTLWQMVEMHEMVPGKRFDRYHELGQHAFGDKLGLWIVVPQQLVVEVSLNIVYMVTGGNSLKKFHDVICDGKCKDIKLTYFIMIFASVHFVLSQLPNFNSISGISLAAAVMSLSYSTIAWGASLHKGKAENVDYSLRASTTPGQVFGFLGGLGDVAFSYSGHNVVLEIQATIPSTPGNPSKKPMWKGVVVAYIIIAACYMPVAFIGYWAFGNSVDDNILITLNKPKWLIAMANMMVVVHLIGSYQDLRDASVRHDGDVPGEEAGVRTRHYAPSDHPDHLCCLHDVRRHDLPVLRWPHRVLRRAGLCADDLFPALHHVAHHLQAQEIQPLMVHQLDLHRPWCDSDDHRAHRRAQTDHHFCQDIQVLLIDHYNRRSSSSPRDLRFYCQIFILFSVLAKKKDHGITACRRCRTVCLV
uniref:Amino acid transporter transmembrane domain-containing protein n=1 Tax=Aegilops tauschii subsp. strangulata TaxID=200361 RepID=A0A453S0D1_AEGTS